MNFRNKLRKIGNAINDFVEQVESQVFCKLFALNHRDFEYEYCNFSKKNIAPEATEPRNSYLLFHE